MKTFTASLLLAAANAHPGNHSHPHNSVLDHIQMNEVDELAKAEGKFFNLLGDLFEGYD